MKRYIEILLLLLAAFLMLVFAMTGTFEEVLLSVIAIGSVEGMMTLL